VYTATQGAGPGWPVPPPLDTAKEASACPAGASSFGTRQHRPPEGKAHALGFAGVHGRRDRATHIRRCQRDHERNHQSDQL